MENCNITLTIIGIIGSCGGIIIGVILGYFLNKKNTREIIRIQEFNKAASIFRSAFTEEIRLLKKGNPSDNWLEGTAYLIIQNAFIKHENARILFEPFLNNIDRISFDRLWEEYRSKETKEVIPNDDFFCYHSDPGDFKTENNKRELALERIDKLMEYVNIK